MRGDIIIDLRLTEWGLWVRPFLYAVERSTSHGNRAILFVACPDLFVLVSDGGFAAPIFSEVEGKIGWLNLLKTVYLRSKRKQTSERAVAKWIAASPCWYYTSVRSTIEDDCGLGRNDCTPHQRSTKPAANCLNIHMCVISLSNNARAG